MAEHNDDTIDLREILGIILNHKWLILIVTAIFACGGWFYTKIRLPQYETKALLSISQGSNSNVSSLLGSKGGVASMVGGQTSQAQKEIDIIQSRSVLEPVVKQFNLDISVSTDYFPLIGKRMAYDYEQGNYQDKPAEPVMGLSGYAWGGDYVKINSLKVGKAWKGKAFRLVYNGGNQYTLYDGNKKKLGSSRIGKQLNYRKNPYEYIKLDIDKISARPGTAFTLAKRPIAQAVQSLAGHLKIEETKKGSNLLALYYRGSDPVRITHILNAVAESAVNAEIQRKSRNAEKVLGFLRKQLPQVHKELRQAEKKLTNYQEKTGTISISENGKIILEQLSSFDKRIAEMELKKAQMAEKLTENNPELAQMNNTLKKLKKQKAELEKKVKQLPSSDQIAMNLMREVEIQSKLYKSILQRIEQYEIMKVGTLGKLELISRADIPYQNTNKSSSLIIALCIILGLFLSIAYIFIRDYLFRGIEDPDIIEEKFDLPIFGSLHNSEVQRKQEKRFKQKKTTQLKLLNDIDTHNLTVEGLRSVRTNLLFQLMENSSPVIAIGGATPEVGKSFVCANLAQIMAESGKRICLIDGDTRKGDLHHYFSGKRTPGLIEVLLNKQGLEAVIQQTGHTNLDVIPSGDLNLKHADTLDENHIQTIFEQLSQQYDLVMVDTAPILAVTDGAHLMKHAGINLLVLASGKHDDKEVKLTLKRFDRAGVTINGFIFNMVPQSTSYYGNKYKYQYAYQYK